MKTPVSSTLIRTTRLLVTTSKGGHHETPLPLVGYRNGSNVNNVGNNGNCWSSTPNEDNENNAYNAYFNYDDANVNNNNRYNGNSVRLVSVQQSSYDLLYMSFVLSYQQLRSDLEQAFLDASRHKRNKRYVTEFADHLEANLDSLAEELFSRQWKPLPSVYFGTDNREVFAARFRDRIVHHLYYNYTNVLFDRTFIHDSYSCRKGKGTHYGVERLEGMIRKESHNYTRKCYVLSLDIKGYFMHIDRKLLCDTVLSSLEKMRRHKVRKHRRETWDDMLDFPFLQYLTETLALHEPLKDAVVTGEINTVTSIPPRKRLRFSPKGKGIAIGNLTAQLFSNIFLNLLDQFVKRVLKVRHYGRYVDDPRLVSTSKSFLKDCLQKIETFVNQVLGMELQYSKVRISDAYKGVAFLGAYVLPFRKYIHNSTLKKIRNGIKEIRSSYIHHSISLARLVSSMDSYIGTLSHYRAYTITKSFVLSSASPG